MTTPATEWQSLCDAFGTLGRHIHQVRAINVNAKSLRVEAKEVAQKYFRVRPLLLNLGLDEEISVLDSCFENLVHLSSGMNAASSYKKQIKSVRKLLPKITTRLELNQSLDKAPINTSVEDRRIIQTLEGLIPSAALSYQQAIIDLADQNRLSFRGPASELREVLRETLDHLAPDSEVVAAPGYIQDKGRNGPTMKQKVRFILRARGQSKSSSMVPEQTTTTIDEMVGTLTRSIYDRSSVATHVALERKTVAQIRRYVVALLHDILEL